jgi:hypothetical protein
MVYLLKYFIAANQFHSSHCNQTIIKFGKAMKKLRFLYFCIGAYITVVLLPTYGVFSMYFGKYENGYAWTVSASFLSGKLPALVILLLLIIFIILIIYIMRKDFRFKKNITIIEEIIQITVQL